MEPPLIMVEVVFVSFHDQIEENQAQDHDGQHLFVGEKRFKRWGGGEEAGRETDREER